MSTKPSIICVRCLFNVASFGEICIACGSPFIEPIAKRKCIRKNTVVVDVNTNDHHKTSCSKEGS